MSQKLQFRGFFNRYQKSKSLGKYLLEDLRCLFDIAHYFIANRFRHRKLLVFPHYPSKKASIYRIARESKFFLSNRLEGNPEIAIYWEYKTHRDEFERLKHFCRTKNIRIVNFHSRDISKFFVDDVFSRVFGYSTKIDPYSHEGPFVQKSDINAKHDGRIHRSSLTGPIDPDSIYQVLIDNSTGDGMVRDLRVPIFGKEIPFVYEKFRPEKERFLNTTVKTNLLQPNEVFTADEIAKIIRFCQEAQLEHGELDVLRDKNSGLIYIVDVNNTPQSPPANCSPKTRRLAKKLMTDAFFRNLTCPTAFN